MTLLQEIQRLIEHTYSDSGVNLEECVIGRKRCHDLSRKAGAPALSPFARTFLRQEGDRLYVAIYYAEPLIEALEKNDPRLSISEANIAPLIQFIEEIDHAVQAALQFQEGQPLSDSEDCIMNFEVMAKVDTYLVLAKFACCHCGSETLTPEVRRWLTDQIFDMSYEKFQSRILQARYKIAQELAVKFLAHLKTLPLSRRRRVLRKFRKMTWREKICFVHDVSPFSTDEAVAE